MKKIFNWTVNISLIFLAASALTYTIHYFIFHDVHHIFLYMIGDIGFLFIDVLLVVLFIERILSRREKRAILQKLNMVIGTFFSEVGVTMLSRFSGLVENAEEIQEALSVRPNWTDKDFKAASKRAASFVYNVRPDAGKLQELRTFLHDKRDFLLRLLENPNILEHENFTDLLWAVFHMGEELQFRTGDFKKLPKSDLAHLANDLKRAYSLITKAWIDYTGHLKQNYPFLFSLAVRINPLNIQADPVVQE
ncbi:MAG: hypothetical protein JXB26_16930 [Candidatus Aminicenantes bacterium]|nr:hypothetical protein [Candidatus Aminicenantes bacterium]